MSTPSRSALTNALIVDDERDIRELLVLTLGRMGLKCDTASSLKDARALLRHTPLGRLGEGRDIAYAALFLCSPAAAWISGQVLTVSGGGVQELD